jgi:acetylornithine deacetylase
MNAIENRLIEAVDQSKDDILDLTAGLVSEASTLGNERSVLELMEDELTRLSFHPHRVPIDPGRLKDHPGFANVSWSYSGRYNLVATRQAESSGGRSALFNGHLDVVSEQPVELWESDPYDPIIRDGWMYGRGSGDMKSGIAAMIYAVKAIERAGLGLKAPVIVETVIEEECSGNGTLACLDAGFDADAVLIPEPFGMKIMKGELGVLWFKVNLSGVPSHVGDAQAGVNAIEKCFPLIAALRELEEEMNQNVHPAYQSAKHPINFNVGIIKGGDWPSTVAASAEFHCRLSYFPGQSYDQICRTIRNVIANRAAADPWLSDNPPNLEFYGLRTEGHVIEDDPPPFQTVAGCHRDLTGEPIESMYTTATTDARVFQFYGRSQATCYGPVAENIHAANERVLIESVMATARLYALFLARWCGLVE